MTTNIDRPGRRGWRGATLGALAVLVVWVVAAAYSLMGAAGLPRVVAGIVFFLGFFALVGGALMLLVLLVRRVPALYLWVILAALVVLIYFAMVALSVVLGVVVVGLGLLIAASLLGAGVVLVARDGWREASALRRVGIAVCLALGLAGVGVGAIWLLDDGRPAATVPAATLAQAAAGDTVPAPLALPDPSSPGPYAVRTLIYGSGTDRHRPAYAGGVDLVTEPVDGSALVTGWSRLRTAYWGFGPEALPRNGRIWYPDGEGPFPLVLFQHGQHPMEHASDPGYAYLGELLASRGYVAVSVDENFLNLSPLADYLVFSALNGVDDLRGWLLLEHLALWRAWAAAPGHPFYGKVDMDAIALVGHSRGGEAVAAAAVLNRLGAYPDDAANGPALDYGFNLRAIVAFAPVAGTYRPAGRAMTLEGVNYLVLHGSHDMDVFTFQGRSQYARVRVDAAPATGEPPLFKAWLYVYGANHGQFNTAWGRKDLFEPVMRLFNLAQLMDAEAQRQVARVAVSAFLDATLRDEPGYRAFFRDPRVGRAWLPETLLLSRYRDGATRLLATFEEDVDPATATVDGGTLEGEGLTVWREEPVAAKWQTADNQVVVLGWDTAVGGAAAYRLRLPEGLAPRTGGDALVFDLADAGVDPTPDDGERWPAPGARSPVDLTVVVVDDQGDAARLPLSHVSLLLPQIEGVLGKARFMSALPSSEPVLHRFAFPLADFVAANPAFDPARLAEVDVVFDRTPAGSIVLDDVALWSP